MTSIFSQALAVFTPILLLISQTFASTCVNPSVTHSSHTSSEAVTATSTVFIVTFDLSCGNEMASAPNLFATLTLGEKIISGIRSVAKTGAGYQASFVGEHAEFPKGSYTVEIFDDEGFAALKKAQRAASEEAGEAAVAPLAHIAVNHGGVWQGDFIRGETTALILVFCAFYLAHSAKSRIQEE